MSILIKLHLISDNFEWKKKYKTVSFLKKKNTHSIIQFRINDSARCELQTYTEQPKTISFILLGRICLRLWLKSREMYGNEHLFFSLKLLFCDDLFFILYRSAFTIDGQRRARSRSLTSSEVLVLFVYFNSHTNTRMRKRSVM